MIGICENVVSTVFWYLKELGMDFTYYLGRIIQFIRHPLACLTAVYLVTYVILQITIVLMHNALSIFPAAPLFPIPMPFPILCRVPIIPYLVSCSSPPPFGDLTSIQTSSFDALQNNAVEGEVIALDIKKMGAMALPTLINAIKKSDLPGHDVLADALDNVVEQAEVTSNDLQDFAVAVEQALSESVLFIIITVYAHS